MLGDFLFDGSEVTINSIGGVWNIEFRVFLICEKIRKICFQTSVSGSDFSMSVVPMLGPEHLGFFVNEVLIFFKPIIQKFGEFFLVAFG